MLDAHGQKRTVTVSQKLRSLEINPIGPASGKAALHLDEISRYDPVFATRRQLPISRITGHVRTRPGSPDFLIGEPSSESVDARASTQTNRRSSEGYLRLVRPC